VALINWGPPNAAVLKAAGAGVIDDWIAAPRLPKDEHFHRGISAFLYTWWRRHSPSFTSVRIIDEPRSARSHEIREWLSRNNLRFKSLDVSSEEARHILTQYDVDGSRLPVVITLFGRALENPSILEIVDSLGATPLQTKASSARYDLTIIGAGPAGLTAAVYGASEGLRTLVLERDSVGGQAGSSMSIRNYPGFMRSVSGSELAMRMFEQAGMFGADFVYGEAVALDRLGEDYRVTLRDRAVVTSRAVIIAAGAAYRRLGIPALEAFTGLGVFYGAAGAEADAMQGRTVHVVGGANSAGQAALVLAERTSHVDLIVRGAALAETMSDYLIRAIAAAPNITVRCRTEVVDGSGDSR
jgi:thioredoxin reductase (NADPH)